MPKPNASFTPPDFSGQTKILFCSEGNPIAMLVTNKKGRHNVGRMKFPAAEAALVWCRRNGVALVYFPVNPDRN